MSHARSKSRLRQTERGAVAIVTLHLTGAMVHPAFTREYRLINAGCEPHGHLDGIYSSHDEAWAEAVQWLEQQQANEDQSVIGLEVSTACGSWRIVRRPSPVLCAWPPNSSMS